MKRILVLVSYMFLSTFALAKELIISETTPSFFALYEQNRQEQVPNYVTLDFILTSTYLFKQQSITKMEEEEMIGLFQELALGLKENLLKDYSPEKKEALAYVLVLNELLDINSTDAPKDALTLAEKELKLIKKHEGIVSSPIAKVKMDYTQFKVRAKYTKNAKLSSYFLALKYMSYMPFMVNAHSAIGVTETVATEQMQNTLYLVKTLKPLSKLYKQIEEKLRVLSGEGDDLAIAVLKDEHNTSTAVQAYVNSLERYPKINERIIDTTQIKAEDIPKATLALKLLPSRFSPDGYIFSKLTYPYVGQVKRKKDKLTSFIDGKNVRGYPTVMDISAVLVNKLPAESKYENYSQQVESLKKDMNLILDNIYAYDFAIYKQLLEDNKTNSFKGYYTQSKYIMNLYQKQSYTGGLKGMFLDNRTEAFLENNISKVLDLVIQELKLFPKSETFSMLIEKVKELDTKTQPYDKEEIQFLNNLDMKFKHLLDSADTPIKVDIHTNPVEEKVMYESLGEPFVKIKGKGRGAVYNHREFISERK
ncbi:MAG: DUF3160 domain-containing protein [Campylobacterota bacterium]|nr:DUF3160 domain-containing protein [Campylobacterota bacterium]